MRWQLRCALDGLKGLVPFQAQLRNAKRRLVGYQANRAYNQFTLQQGLLLVSWLRGGGYEIRDAVLLEVGTGWEPVLPMLLSLAGARRVYLTDTTRLLSSRSFWSSVEFLKSSVDGFAGKLGVEPGALRRSLDGVKASMPLEEMLRQFRMEYLAPCDCRKVPLPDASVDVVFSRAVLEHIPPDIIRGILAESARILKRGGVSFHAVDNSDHFEHRDHSISRVNFLRYEDWVWRWTHVNGLLYQNRLRHSEYVSMLEQAGLKLVREERDIGAEALASVRTMPLARRFAGMEPEDLATLTSYLMATPDTTSTYKGRRDLATAV